MVRIGVGPVTSAVEKVRTVRAAGMARHQDAGGPAGAIRGNATTGIATFLQNLGVARVDERDSVEQDLLALVRDLGFNARIAELRWGRVLLETDAQTAGFLKFCVDDLTEKMAELHPGVVSEVRVRVQRRAG